MPHFYGIPFISLESPGLTNQGADAAGGESPPLRQVSILPSFLSARPYFTSRLYFPDTHPFRPLYSMQCQSSWLVSPA